jgi:hypothetical protein
MGRHAPLVTGFRRLPYEAPHKLAGAECRGQPGFLGIPVGDGCGNQCSQQSLAPPTAVVGRGSGDGQGEQQSGQHRKGDE